MVCLVGTQSFTAERLAIRLEEEMCSLSTSWDVEIVMVDEYEYEILLATESRPVVLLMSTFGIGDPPHNAMAFASWLKASHLSNLLENLHFCVFSLGSTAYPKFGAFGEFVDEKLNSLGGHRLLPLTKGDSSRDIYSDFSCWMKRLVCALSSFSPPLHPHVREKSQRKSLQTHTALYRSSFQSSCVSLSLSSRTELCWADAGKSVLHIRFVVCDDDTEGKCHTIDHLQPGDHMGIYPHNPPSAVSRALSLLHVHDLSFLFPILYSTEKGPRQEMLPISSILERHVDLTGHCSANILRNFIPYITSLHLRALARELTHINVTTHNEDSSNSKSNGREEGEKEERGEEKEKYEEWARGRTVTVLDILEEFQCQPTLHAFLSCAPRIEPRLYSIADCTPKSVDICVTLFTYVNEIGVTQKGLCTGWMCERMAIGEKADVFFRVSDFHPPPQAKPLILFAVGSGIGPYFGFLKNLASAAGVLVEDVTKSVVFSSQSETSSCTPSCSSSSSSEKQSEMDRLLSSHFLFFGCHNEGSVLYRSHIQHFVRLGLNYSAALSRAPIGKAYVQEACLHRGRDIWNSLVNEDAHVYLCGRTDMAKGVRESLIRIGCMQGQSNEEAVSMIDGLKMSGRWHEDTWMIPYPIRSQISVTTSSEGSIAHSLERPKKKQKTHIQVRLEEHEMVSLSVTKSESSVSKVPEWPSYLRLLASGEFEKRVALAQAMWSACVACGRNCEVNRLSSNPSDWGECRVGEYAILSSAGPHFGEEDCLRGTRGSGTIFFGACNLKCCYCQNYEISAMDEGRVVTDEELAKVMLDLQNKSRCHNINFVSPTHNVAPILRAVLIAARKGLKLPLVWNTGGYDSVASLRILDGIIDIYMPDMKYANKAIARRLSQIENYPDVNQAAVMEMHRQVGDLQFDKKGIATRGVLVRHLVLPNDLAGTSDIARFLVTEVSSQTYVNVMGQYRPCHKAVEDRKYGLSRKVNKKEVRDAFKSAEEMGIVRFDERWMDW